MKKRQTDSDVVLGYAWYRPEQWALLRASSVDGNNLEERFEDWEPHAEESFKQYKREGLDIEKIDVDVEELIRWCKEEGKPLDGAARSEFAAKKLREKRSNK